MNIKNLKFIDKSKKKAFLFCLTLVARADGVITDEENSGVFIAALNFLKLEEKEALKIINSKLSKKEAGNYVDALNKSSSEELTLLGILMGIIANIDGEIDKEEIETIKSLLTIGGLNESIITVIIKSLSETNIEDDGKTAAAKKKNPKNKAKLGIDADNAKNLGEFIDAILQQFNTLKPNDLIAEGSALFHMIKSQYNKLSETISGIGLDFFLTYFANLTEKDGDLIDQEKKYLQQAVFEGKKELASMVDNLALLKTSRLDETFEYLNSTRMETDDSEVGKNIGLLFFYHFLLGVVFCTFKGNITKSRRNVLEKYLYLDLEETKNIFNIYKMVSPLSE